MKKKISFSFANKAHDLVYVYLPGHPRQVDGSRGCVKQSIRLVDLMDYEGPDLIIDFDASGRLIGVEIDADVESLHKGAPIIRPKQA